jgi:hypothetical protein
MFSVDGDHLIATHYCSAGNQPQMTTYIGYDCNIFGFNRTSRPPGKWVLGSARPVSGPTRI